MQAARCMVSSVSTGSTIRWSWRRVSCARWDLVSPLARRSVPKAKAGCGGATKRAPTRSAMGSAGSDASSAGHVRDGFLDRRLAGDELVGVADALFCLQQRDEHSRDIGARHGGVWIELLFAELHFAGALAGGEVRGLKDGPV